MKISDILIIVTVVFVIGYVSYRIAGRTHVHLSNQEAKMYYRQGYGDGEYHMFEFIRQELQKKDIQLHLNKYDKGVKK